MAQYVYKVTIHQTYDGETSKWSEYFTTLERATYCVDRFRDSEREPGDRQIHSIKLKRYPLH